MDNKVIYKILIWTGLLIFIVGIIGDANAIPYLRQGAIIGPVLFFLGTIIWIPQRVKNPILHPFNSNKYRTGFDASFAVIFDNFLLEFWTFCCAFGMLIILGGGAAMKSSDGFEAAILLLQEDEKVKNQIGELNGPGVLVGGSTSRTMAKLGFSVYGSKGSARIDIEVIKSSGEWDLVSLEID